MDKQKALREYFGYDSFRPGQEALIDAILAGRDAFGVMPTGGVKSLCYQIPALLLEGLTDVINTQINSVSDYVGYAVPVKNFNKVYNAVMPGYADSVKAALYRTQGKEVAQYLEKGLTYAQIAEITHASTATISRVNRCLVYGEDGYQLALQRMRREEEKE